ncbi:MAG: hypothetical protein LAT64_13985 [Phycisphaerales bacterium]|nr:hypothetical protein [Planctomycetota bacterium]MCH8509860.1 hypothetical protein [Phycisphaerales bacterium]
MCSRICLIGTIVACVAGLSSAQSGHDLAQSWVEQCRRLNSVVYHWIDTQDVIDTAGRVAYSFDKEEVVLVDWPDRIEHRSRVIETGEVRVSAAAMRFDRDFFVNGSGRVSESYVKRSAQNSAVVDTPQRLAVTQASFAPSLVGVWFGEMPDGSFEVEPLSDSSFSVSSDDLGLRAFVRRVGNDGASRGAGPLAVYRLEMMGADGHPRLWWEYDDFRPAGNTGAAVGHVRVSYSILRDGSMHESMPAMLKSMRRADLAASGENFSDERAGAGSGPTVADQGSERSGRRTRTLLSAGPLMLWLGAGVVVIAGVFWGAGRLRS